MDYRFHIETGIDERDMAADGYVPVPRRWRGQLPIEIGRRRMHLLAKILVERSALPKAGFLIGG